MISVFPIPGGPKSATPFGTRPPTFAIARLWRIFSTSLAISAAISPSRTISSSRTPWGASRSGSILAFESFQKGPDSKMARVLSRAFFATSPLVRNAFVKSSPNTKSSLNSVSGNAFLSAEKKIDAERTKSS